MARHAVRLLNRPEIGQVMADYKNRTDARTGDSQAGKKAIRSILEDFYQIRTWPNTGSIVPGMAKNWRRRLVGTSHMFYYYVEEDNSKIYGLSLRGASQEELSAESLYKYLGQIRDNPEDR